MSDVFDGRPEDGMTERDGAEAQWEGTVADEIEQHVANRSREIVPDDAAAEAREVVNVIANTLDYRAWRTDNADKIITALREAGYRITGDTGVSREKSDLDLWLTATYGDRVQREVRFHPTRRWRFDWLVGSTAIEYDGLIGGAAHTAIRKVANDAAKSNAAQLMGYTIIRVNAISLRDGSGYQDIEQAVEIRGGKIEARRSEFSEHDTH